MVKDNGFFEVSLLLCDHCSFCLSINLQLAATPSLNTLLPCAVKTLPVFWKLDVMETTHTSGWWYPYICIICSYMYINHIEVFTLLGINSILSNLWLWKERVSKFGIEVLSNLNMILSFKGFKLRRTLNKYNFNFQVFLLKYDIKINLSIIHLSNIFTFLFIKIIFFSFQIMHLMIFS